MELMKLSDDALVSVLRFVELEDLFTCRLVCKRLGGLALHWDVWRHRVIKIMYASRAKALLHLVPCLQEATVDDWDILALTRSKCAVANLNLVGPKRDHLMTYYPEAVRNQEALGRLRRLHLLFKDDYDEDASKELAKAVMACSALVELKIEGYSLFKTHSVTQEPARPTLRKLQCTVGSEDLPFVNALLAGHGSTLQIVILSVVDGSHTDTMSRLLGAMPHLRSLSCPAMPGLQAVAASPMLKNLSLRVRMTSQPNIVQDAVELLHQAKLLNKVQIFINAVPGVTEKLIKALGSSASRLIVEQVQLNIFHYNQMRALLSTLPSLPALRNLKVIETSRPFDDTQPADALDKLLMAITPETAPALRTLEVSLSNFDCAHAWIHRDAVGKALTRNPSLHILLIGSYDFHCDHCEKCYSRCHARARSESVWKICLFSHDSDKCTLSYHSNATAELRKWIQIDPNVEEPDDCYGYDPAFDFMVYGL